MQKFLSELQRRKVLRIASGYVVVAWVILQVALSLQTALKLPDSFATIVVSLLIIGFPIALVVSWFFEITPEGIKRTVASGDGVLIKPQTTDIALAAALALVVIVGVAQLMMPRESAPVAPATTAEAPTAEGGPADKAPAVEIPEASVAVLPFENLSTDKNNAFFAIGIQDEILTRLSKIGSLKVISRTSTAHLASRPDNLPEIAKKLGVANILEGSVQRDGNDVRVNVQLIKASTDSHLWAEVYDRKLDHIFTVQSEIAIAIADALSAKVTGGETKEVTFKSTGNTAAYDAYLRGQALARESRTEEAITLLNEAVRLDPSFALAWASLMRREALLYFGFKKTASQREKAKTALDTALRLQPDLAEVQLAKGFYHYHVERDYKTAQTQFEKVHTQWPNDPETLLALALIERRLGRWAESNAHFKQAISRDPLRTEFRVDLATSLAGSRDYESALQMIDTALSVSPNNGNAVATKASILLHLGRIDEAGIVLKPLLQPKAEDDALFLVAHQAMYRREYGEAIKVLQGILAKKPDRVHTAALNTRLGHLHALLGQEESSTAFLKQAQTLWFEEMAKQPDNASVIENLAVNYCLLGDRVSALKYIDKAIAWISNDVPARLSMEETRMRILAYFGDRDRAIPEIERLLTQSYFDAFSRSDLRLDPVFDKLRGDPRFEALARGDEAPK